MCGFYTTSKACYADNCSGEHNLVSQELAEHYCDKAESPACSGIDKCFEDLKPAFEACKRLQLRPAFWCMCATYKVGLGCFGACEDEEVRKGYAESIVKKGLGIWQTL
jgi:hypothetical protein